MDRALNYYNFGERATSFEQPVGDGLHHDGLQGFPASSQAFPPSSQPSLLRPVIDDALNQAAGGLASAATQLLASLLPTTVATTEATTLSRQSASAAETSPGSAYGSYGVSVRSPHDSHPPSRPSGGPASVLSHNSNGDGGSVFGPPGDESATTSTSQKGADRSASQNYVGMLNEVAQMRRLPVPRYSDPLRVAGSDHNPLFSLTCRLHSPDFSVLLEGEGTATTIKLAKHQAAKRVLEQLGQQPNAILERPPPRPQFTHRLPDHVQPPLAMAKRVVFIDLGNQQDAQRTYLARPDDFVVCFITARMASTFSFAETPWPVMIVHSQAKDCVHSQMCWELCKILMGDGRRVPPAPPLDVVIVSRDLHSEAVRDVVRLDPDTAPRTRIYHYESSADVPL